MSNFSALDKDHLNKLLEPFAPEMTPLITPIKYEALTPDCFLLLFRTTGKNGEDHFFVSLETDYLNSLEGARCTIEDWHGNIIDFWKLRSRKDVEASENIDDYKVSTSGPYYAVLAEVEKPTHKGYWSEAVKIMPGDNIGEVIKDFSEKEQTNIRKTLATILRHKIDPTVSFMESLHAKRKNTVVDDVNNTDIAVSLYVQPDGKVECFYNYIQSAKHSKK